MDNVNILALIVLFIVAAVVVVTFLVLVIFFGPKRTNASKKLPFECGTEGVGDARSPFPIKYYLAAIIFAVFDVEVAFLYPWAVSFKSLHLVGFISMVIFLAVLAIGLYYAIKRGVFEWK
jgi:NADH-quinone oxidoreductase subunit A